MEDNQKNHLRRGEEQEGSPPLERIITVHHHFLLFDACTAPSTVKLPFTNKRRSHHADRDHDSQLAGRAPSGTLVDPPGMTGSLTTWNLGASP